MGYNPFANRFFFFFLNDRLYTLHIREVDLLIQSADTVLFKYAYSIYHHTVYMYIIHVVCGTCMHTLAALQRTSKNLIVHVQEDPTKLLSAE